MKQIKQINKKISKNDRIISIKETSYLLAEFFNGQVIKLDKEYIL